jgi:hypothetical protein
MKMDLLYLLPALAVMICLTGAVLPLKNTRYYLKGSRRRRYSRSTIITARFTVIALLLATAITLIWPVKGVDALFQGLTITFICLVPLIVYQLVTILGRRFFGVGVRSSSRQKSRRSGLQHNNRADAKAETPADNLPENANAKVASIGTPKSESGAEIKPIPVVSRSPIDKEEKTRSARVSSVRVKGSSSQVSFFDRSTEKLPNSSKSPEPAKIQEKQDPEVREQMDRVSTLVKSYDLGDEKADQEKRVARTLNKKQLANASADATTTGEDDSTDLASHNAQALQVSRTEALRKVISTLQDDKRKLQRLVIAQQAAFDSERQSHERTRHVARDAIKVMRDARSGQRMAEKIARRERAERRRLEKEYTKVTRALKNAMSTLANAEKDNTSAA